MVWYGMVWGENEEFAGDWYTLIPKTTSLRCSVISLMHIVDPYGAAQIRLVNYTHGHHDRSSTRPKVWFKFTAYSTSLLASVHSHSFLALFYHILSTPSICVGVPGVGHLKVVLFSFVHVYYRF